MSRSNRRPARRIPGFVRPADPEKESAQKRRQLLSFISQEQFEMLRDRTCSLEEFKILWQGINAKLRMSIVSARAKIKKEQRLKELAEAAERKALKKLEKEGQRLTKRQQLAEARKRAKILKEHKAKQSRIEQAEREARSLEAQQNSLQQVNNFRKRSPLESLVPVKVDDRTVIMMRAHKDPAKVISIYKNHFKAL